MGPTGLILSTNDGIGFSRIGGANFYPSNKHDIRRIGDFNELLQQSNNCQAVQERPFQRISPRTITLI
jgi:hypothetical protein